MGVEGWGKKGDCRWGDNLRLSVGERRGGEGLRFGKTRSGWVGTGGEKREKETALCICSRLGEYRRVTEGRAQPDSRDYKPNLQERGLKGYQTVGGAGRGGRTAITQGIHWTCRLVLSSRRPCVKTRANREKSARGREAS